MEVLEAINDFYGVFSVDRSESFPTILFDLIYYVVEVNRVLFA